MRRPRTLVRVVLGGALVVAGACTTPPSTDTSIHRCEDAKACASCLEADGELCLWCAASASCLRWPAACPSGGGNHGYFVDSTRFRIEPAAAEAICQVPCALKGERLVSAEHGLLDPNRCCSSSQPSSDPSGSSCAASFTGEACVTDADCVKPETCQHGACVGTPATAQIVCEPQEDGCGCYVDARVDVPVQPSCDAEIASGTVCCAASGWPTPDPGGGGDCYCRKPWKCRYAMPTSCVCDASITEDDPDHPGCTGQICCTDHRASCNCFDLPYPGFTCAVEHKDEVSSCTNATIGCDSLPKHTEVASCYEAAAPDAGD